MNSFTLNNGITMPALGFGTFKMNGEECAQSVAEAICSRDHSRNAPPEAVR